MSREDAIKENITLKDKIASLPDGSILFRSDYPEYHSEFVGSTLAELTDDGILSKIAQGIYAFAAKHAIEGVPLHNLLFWGLLLLICSTLAVGIAGSRVILGLPSLQQKENHYYYK